METSNGETPINSSGNINDINVNVFSQERSNSLTAKDVEVIQAV